MTLHPVTWKEIHRFGIELGILCAARGEVRLGARLLVSPVDYWRLVEIPLVINNLRMEGEERVLDIGSPKICALYLSARLGKRVRSIDLLEENLTRYRLLGRFLDLRRGTGELAFETQDARALCYEDGSFERVYSISVIEHIPDRGDSKAMGEIGRVLSPGGIACITVPFGKRYRERYVEQDVYERSYVDGQPIFFERIYDEEALKERLVGPSGLTLLDVDFYEERFVRLGWLFGEAPLVMQLPLLPLQPLLAGWGITRIEPWTAPSKAAMACVTLVKE